MTTLFDADTIQTRFNRFHHQHPEVYAHLVNLTREAIYTFGRTKVGIKQLFEVLRWERMIAGLPSDGEAFKLNNNYTSRYARLIMTTEPDLTGVFELRELSAQ